MMVNQSKKNIFRDARGRIRFGWKWTAGLLLYIAALGVILGGLGVLCTALFRAWGVTADNLYLAPAWAQKIVLWHSDAIHMLAYGLSGAAGLWFASRWIKGIPRNGKAAGLSVIAGLSMGIVLTLLARIADSMRLEWPLTEPAFSIMHLSALAVLGLGCFSRAVLTQRLVMDPVKDCFGRAAAYASVIVAALILSGRWTHPISLINAALMAAAGCAVYEAGGLSALVLLQVAWTVCTQWLFAWPGSGLGVYRLYHVSDAWFTGGYVGVVGGLGCTFLWGGLTLYLFRNELRGLAEKVQQAKEKKLNGSVKDVKSGSTQKKTSANTGKGRRKHS